MAQQMAVAAAQACNDDDIAKMEEIDKEMDDVCMEAPPNRPHIFSINEAIDQDDGIIRPENAEEDEKDEAPNANANYFS